MRSSHCSTRRGFTLVEMLVVIMIIGVLMAILIPTVAAAIRKAKNTAMGVEVNNLASAMESYKQKYGDFPPDFSDPTVVAGHVKRAFPRSNLDLNPTSPTGWWVMPPWAGTHSGLSPTTLDPAEALVFWLSAIKDNPRNPLHIDITSPSLASSAAGSVDGPGDAVSFFEFDEKRFSDLDGDGWPEYLPEHSDTPYVYFDGRLSSGRYFYNTTVYGGAGSGFGTVRPYRSNEAIDNRDNNRTQPNTPPNTTQWIDPGKFQIHCAGLDSHFGEDITAPNTFKAFPDPNYQLAAEDEDNLTSFSEGTTIQENVP